MREDVRFVTLNILKLYPLWLGLGVRVNHPTTQKYPLPHHQTTEQLHASDCEASEIIVINTSS